MQAGSAPAGRLANARALAESGRIAEAEEAYRQLLDGEPDQVQALTFLAQCALRRRDPQEAVDFLERAHGKQADDPQILKNLGVAYDIAGDAAAARNALESSLRLAPEHFQARLHLASLYERSGMEYEALANYFRAMTTAQTAGRWLDRATTPVWLQDKVLHAMDAIEHGRSRLFNGCLDPLRAAYGSSELGRVQQWLDGYLSMNLSKSPDDRQRAKFMHLPGLPSQPYYDRGLFPFTDRIEAETEAIREEMRACLSGNDGFVPFLEVAEETQLDEYLQGSRGRPAWDAFFFYRHGEAQIENQQRCPRTMALLESLPLVRIRDHAPEVCFSVLTAGTHILPHHGVTNTRLVLHLPLLVPDDCSLVVGGERHAWQEGRCVIFDDTYLHEAWNRSACTRAVLIMDVWNPHLTEVERVAITELVGTIGDFNRASQG